jgi:hypothetical protein
MFLRLNVSFYAHESVSKYYCLADRVVTDGITHYLFMTKLRLWNCLFTGSLGQFFECFRDQGYITKTAIEEKQLEIWIVWQRGSSSKQPTSLGFWYQSDSQSFSGMIEHQVSKAPGDDTQPGNPNKWPNMALFGIIQVRGRVRGGLSVTIVNRQ